jgi:hypothetical protein
MRYGLGLVLALSLSSAPLWADPPGRVGRINFVTGAVSFRPASLDEWAPASMNYPMTTGDHLWCDQDGRAEVHVGSTVFRLGSETAFEFLNLDDRTIQVKLPQGQLIVHARELPQDQILEVDTPNSAVSIDRPGIYRIQVGQDGKSTVTVRHGEVELTAAGQAVPVRPAQQAYVQGGNPAQYDVEDAGPEDQLEDWALDRDQHEEQVEAAQYVSPQVNGYENLDGYGHWQTTGAYGAAWVPAVEPGWAPYRAGHWAWVAPWGWTWVDDAPWGFAPFHYGRWAYTGGAWGWYPGPIIAQPVYAPALVAFAGGGGWSASLSFGAGFAVGGPVAAGVAVGWFPLGPHEVYVPPYPVGVNYVRQVNITQVTNINVNNMVVNNGVVTNVNVQRTYINQSVPGAVTAVPQQAFVSGHSVATVAAVVPATAAASITAASSSPPAAVRPVPASVLGQSAVGLTAVPRPPAAVTNAGFVAKVAPPPPAAPFSPTLSPVTTGLPPRPATQATGIPGLRPAVPLNTTGSGLQPVRPNLVSPRIVSSSEVHALPLAQGTGSKSVTGSNPALTGATPYRPVTTPPGTTGSNPSLKDGYRPVPMPSGGHLQTPPPGSSTGGGLYKTATPPPGSGSGGGIYTKPTPAPGSTTSGSYKPTPPPGSGSGGGIYKPTPPPGSTTGGGVYNKTPTGVQGGTTTPGETYKPEVKEKTTGGTGNHSTTGGEEGGSKGSTGETTHHTTTNNTNKPTPKPTPHPKPTPTPKEHR